VTEGPILSGRDAIEKFYADGFKSGDSGLVLHIAESRIMGNSAWAIGDWTVLFSGKPLHGNWVTLFVPDGGAWKMRVDTSNVIEASPK
jgi:ketosteroid isomerase-like protein